MRAIPATVCALSLAAVGCSATPPRSAHASPEDTAVSQPAGAGAAQTPDPRAPINACIADHPASDPFDIGDFAAAPAPGVPVMPMPPPVLIIADECRRQSGGACDPGSFMSKQAAECIAELHGFEKGFAPWTASLGYYDTFKRVAWSVMNIQTAPNSDGYWGKRLAIDAVSGEVLDESSYRVIP